MKPAPTNTILQDFQKHVNNSPEHVAIVYENASLTYEEANRISDNLAAYIESKVPQKSVVGICSQPPSAYLRQAALTFPLIPRIRLSACSL